jgi:hypothetical protein
VLLCTVTYLWLLFLHVLYTLASFPLDFLIMIHRTAPGRQVQYHAFFFFPKHLSNSTILCRSELSVDS